MKHLPNSLTAIIKISINRYLGLDPGAKSRLKILAGKILEIEIRELGLPFYVEFHEDSVSVEHSCEKEPNAYIAITIPTMIKFGFSSDSTANVLSERIEMSGDIEVGKEFQKLLLDVDIDWEEVLSKYTGDVVAHQIGRQVRFLKDWANKTSTTLMVDLSEYLREESKYLPSKQEVVHYNNAVDEVRMAVDRAEARLKFIQDSISNNSKNNNKAK